MTSLWGDAADCREPSRLSRHFICAFDHIFGRRVYADVSFPYFYRAALATIVTAVILLFVWWSQFDEDNPARLINRSPDFWPGVAPYAISFWVLDKGFLGPWYLFLETIVIFLVLLNIFPDYLSVVETRYILSKIAHVERVMGKLKWLFLDLCFTAAIALVSLLFWITIMYTFGVGERYTENNFEFYTTVAPLYALHGLALPFGDAHPGFNIAGVYIYTTLLTSFSAWLFLISAFLIRVFRGPVRPVRRLIYVERYPVQVCGAVVACLWTVLCLGLFGLHALG